MSTLQEPNDWADTITQIDTTDPVMGGPDGIDNLPHRQLAARTRYLRKTLDALAAAVTALAADYLPRAATAVAAAKWATARKLTLKGAVSGAVSLDGSADVEIQTTAAAATDAAAGAVELATPDETKTGTDATRAVTPAGLTARLAQPVANALTAAKWATPRKLTLVGAATGSVILDGSADVAFVTAGSENLIPNARFDQGALGWRYNDSTAAPTLNSGWGADWGPSGSMVMPVGRYLWSPVMKVEPGAAYDVSAYIAVNNNTLVAGVDWLDPSGNVLSTTVWYNAAGGNNTVISSTVAAPTVCYFARFYIGQTNGSTPGAFSTPTMRPRIIPAGTIAYYAARTPPPGWLAANGALLNRTTYAALFAAIGTTFGAGDGTTTFALPDLRAAFLRAWDNGRGVDPGRAFGDWQLDQIGSHGHDVIGWGRIGRPDYGTGLASAGGGDGYINPNTGNLLASPTGGNETRPHNVALLACIKY